jgi:hypothetical protein
MPLNAPSTHIQKGEKRMRRMLIAVGVVAALVVGSGSASANHRSPGKAKKKGPAGTSVFASGLNNPRGLTFGPGGNLYVAEGGLGGADSTVGLCTQASGAGGPYTGSTNNKVLGGRISKVTPGGVVSTVVDALPSSQTSAAIGSLVSGVSSVAFINHKLYGLLAGAGCSHGVKDVPNGVISVGAGGTWSLLANLSAFQAANPVADPDLEDFEPDGTWYSMISAGGALYPMDSNHGELDRVDQHGNISRVVDISAQVGHIVPTAIALRGDDDEQGHHSHGWKGHGHGKNYRIPKFFIGNLGVFGPPDGTVPNEHVYRLSRKAKLTVFASGLEQVLGLAFRHGKLYALESSTTPGGPTPGTGAIVRVKNGGPAETVASGLIFPTGMTVGPDGAFYVSEQGFGFPAGAGRVIRIVVH